MIPTIAPLRNVAALMALIERVESSPTGLERMAVFHGRSGEGKSMAVAAVANEFDAYCVQVKSLWNPSYFLKKTLTELGVKKPRGTNPALADQAAERLMLSNRPLIIDDAQYLLKRQMIDVVRDIYESCKSTIILVGEQELPLHLTKHENVHNRQQAWVQAVPCNMADAEHLAAIYAKGVTLDEALMVALVEASDFQARRISNNLASVRELARSKGRNTADLDLWGDRTFHTGEPPVTKRAGGVAVIAPPAPTAKVKPLRRRKA